MGTWQYEKSKVYNKNSKDEKIEGQFKGKSVSFSEAELDFAGEKCQQPKYKTNSYVPEEYDVPPDEFKGTAWFRGLRDDKPKKVEMLVVVCDALKKDYYFERVGSNRLLLTGSTTLIYYKKK